MNEIEKSGKELVLDQDKIELLKRTIAKGATDDEFALFLNQSKRTGLDPFSRQIHLVKRKRWNAEKNTMEEVATIQVGIDGYRLIAERTGRYIPGEITYKEKDGVLVSATATVLKIYEDKPYPITAEARFDEYCPRSKEGKILGLWTKFPFLMLGKCAESLALRRAFPQELSGMYTDAEMSQGDAEDKAIKKEIRETARREAKESQKALNAHAQVEIEVGRLQVASPPVEPTPEEIRAEGQKTFGGELPDPPGGKGIGLDGREPLAKPKPSIPLCPTLPVKPLEALRKEMDSLLEIQGISRGAFMSACVGEFKHVLGDWDIGEWGKAVQYLKDMADGRLTLEVAGGQGSFGRFEEPTENTSPPSSELKLSMCQAIWTACLRRAKAVGKSPEEMLKEASGFTPKEDGATLRFLTLVDLQKATKVTKWLETTLRKLDIPEKEILF